MEQETGDGSSKKFIRNVFLLIIWVSIVFLMIISILGIKINENVACGKENYIPENIQEFVPSSTTLNNTQTSALQYFEIDTSDVSYQFCFGINTSTPNRISVVDSLNNTLGVVFVDNTINNYCTSIDTNNLVEKDYYGIRCDSCSSNQVNILKYAVGKDISLITTNFNDEVELFQDDPYYFQIKANRNCKKDLKFFTILYISLLLVFMMVILMLTGYESFKKHLFGDW